MHPVSSFGIHLRARSDASILHSYSVSFFLCLYCEFTALISGLLLNREIGLIVHLFDIRVRHPMEGEKRNRKPLKLWKSEYAFPT